ncbi:MAG: hypothetical protein L3J75_11300 [Methylococcaceae bacterium]|nr:hypothetical protein [Methylococcaceae bacterium]
MPPTIVVNEDKDYRLITTTMHLGCQDYVVKVPLFNNYFDQLSLSIFQFHEKQKSAQSSVSLSARLFF